MPENQLIFRINNRDVLKTVKIPLFQPVFGPGIYIAQFQYSFMDDF